MPHRGIEPAPSACRSDAQPTELHPHLIASTLVQRRRDIIGQNKNSVLSVVPVSISLIRRSQYRKKRTFNSSVFSADRYLMAGPRLRKRTLPSTECAVAGHSSQLELSNPRSNDCLQRWSVSLSTTNRCRLDVEVIDEVKKRWPKCPYGHDVCASY